MRVDLGGSIPDWYKKKKSTKQARDGITKLIKYLQAVTSAVAPEQALQVQSCNSMESQKAMRPAARFS